MSVYVMSAVWKNGPKAHGELLVLLALADFADDDGNCWPSMRAIAEKARMTERGAQKIVRRLEEQGFVSTVVGGGRHGCNQYLVTPNVVRPEYGSPPNAETEKPRTREQKPRTRVQETPNGGSPEPSRTIIEPSVEPSAGRDELAEAVFAYNEVAEETGWPKVQVLNSARRSALSNRLKEAGGMAGWRAALAKAQASPFCCGENKTGWQASFDFLIRQSSFAKLMEGNYDARTPAKRSSLETGFARAVAARTSGG